MKRLSISLAALSLALLASPLVAEDFEFDVPVQLSKLDSAFTQGKVSCEVKGLAHDAATGQVSGNKGIVGSGATTFAIARGAYDGTVSVKFNANRPISQPTDGRSYSCALFLIAGSNIQTLCYADALTGQSTGRPPPGWMKLAPGVKGCANASLPGFSGGEGK